MNESDEWKRIRITGEAGGLRVMTFPQPHPSSPQSPPPHLPRTPEKEKLGQAAVLEKRKEKRRTEQW